jgi:hypothetical protein
MKRSKQKNKCFTLVDKAETHITHLKQYWLEELRQNRQENVPDVNLISNKPNNKYSNPDQPLEKYNFEFVNGLGNMLQNPSLLDNPITFASQAFLHMTGYMVLNQILGCNCCLQQGPKMDACHIHHVCTSIQEGSDCSVCLLNYQANGIISTIIGSSLVCVTPKARSRTTLGFSVRLQNKLMMRENRYLRRKVLAAILNLLAALVCTSSTRRVSHPRNRHVCRTPATEQMIPTRLPSCNMTRL